MRDEHDERIDFSPLDFSADPARWERRLAGLTARAVALRRRPHPVVVQLAAWSRPVMMAAAAAVVMAWIPAGWRSAAVSKGAATEVAQRSTAATTGSSTSTSMLVEWALKDEVPSTAEVFQRLGDDDVQLAR